ncbi:MAG: hypothetical protein JWR26_4411 [Pedosphaera sp.]|nr:hypothetical protein [Pedosphaera sp.]
MRRGLCARPRCAKPRTARDRVFACYDGHHGGRGEAAPVCPALAGIVPQGILFWGRERVSHPAGCFHAGCLRTATILWETGGCVAGLAWGLAWTMDGVGLLRLPAVAQKSRVRDGRFAQEKEFLQSGGARATKGAEHGAAARTLSQPLASSRGVSYFLFFVVLHAATMGTGLCRRPRWPAVARCELWRGTLQRKRNVSKAEAAMRIRRLVFRGLWARSSCCARGRAPSAAKGMLAHGQHY